MQVRGTRRQLEPWTGTPTVWCTFTLTWRLASGAGAAAAGESALPKALMKSCVACHDVQRAVNAMAEPFARGSSRGGGGAAAGESNKVATQAQPVLDVYRPDYRDTYVSYHALRGLGVCATVCCEMVF